MDTRYDAGDEVATPDGRGVVVAALTNDFELPQGSEETVAVDASDDTPAYVVALEGPGSTVYRASALRAADFTDEGDGDGADDEAPDPDGSRGTDVVDGEVDGLDDPSDGWDRDGVPSFRSSVGGRRDDAVDDPSEEFGAARGGWRARSRTNRSGPGAGGTGSERAGAFRARSRFSFWFWS